MKLLTQVLVAWSLVVSLGAAQAAKFKMRVPASAEATDNFRMELFRCSNESQDPQQRMEISVFVPIEDYKENEAIKIVVIGKDKPRGYDPVGFWMSDGKMTISNEGVFEITFGSSKFSGTAKTWQELSTPPLTYKFVWIRGEGRKQDFTCFRTRFGA